MSVKSNREPKSNYFPKQMRHQAAKMRNEYVDRNNESISDSGDEDDDDADVKFCNSSLANRNSPTLVASATMSRLKSANKYDADYENRYRKSINSLLKSVDFNQMSKNERQTTRTPPSPLSVLSSSSSSSYPKKSTRLANEQTNEINQLAQTAVVANQRWNILRKVCKSII
jgi:hypothetical protein